MNKILQKNLNKVTKDTALVIQKDWKTGAETAVAEVYLDKSLSLEQKISQAFMLTRLELKQLLQKSIWTRVYLLNKRYLKHLC